MKKFKTFYENTILQNIDFDGYNINPENDFDKIQKVYKTFKSEFIHENNKHQNEIFSFSEWLRGLPSILTVPFYNFDILENAKKAGLIKVQNVAPSVLDKKEDQFLTYYWDRLAQAFFTLKNNL
jgi:hypothetical protein